jgi:hypothetical protein
MNHRFFFTLIAVFGNGGAKLYGFFLTAMQAGIT